MAVAVTGSSDSAPRDGLGTLGEEARRLTEALADWLDAGGAAKASSLVGGSAECRVCPFCLSVRALRGTSPEVFDYLADAAASLSAALRELAGEGGASRGSPDRPPATGEPTPRRSTVEHIDLS